MHDVKPYGTLGFNPVFLANHLAYVKMLKHKHISQIYKSYIQWKTLPNKDHDTTKCLEFIKNVQDSLKYY